MRFFGSDFEFAQNVRVYVASWLEHKTTPLTKIYSWKQQNDGLITIWKPIGYLVVIYQLRPACQFGGVSQNTFVTLKWGGDVFL